MNLYEAHHEAGYTANELWDAHIENLHYVLEDIETLLSSIDAERVVLSSDHGQVFGENGVWAILNRYALTLSEKCRGV